MFVFIYLLLVFYIRICNIEDKSVRSFSFCVCARVYARIYKGRFVEFGRGGEESVFFRGFEGCCWSKR